MMNALTIIYATYWAISGSSTLGLFNFYCIVRRRVLCLQEAFPSQLWPNCCLQHQMGCVTSIPKWCITFAISMPQLAGVDESETECRRSKRGLSSEVWTTQSAWEMQQGCGIRHQLPCRRVKFIVGIPCGIISTAIKGNNDRRDT